MSFAILVLATLQLHHMPDAWTCYQIKLQQPDLYKCVVLRDA